VIICISSKSIQIRFQVKDTTDIQKSASDLDIGMGEIKSDDFTFPITNLPFISTNIPAALAGGIYISGCICMYILF